MLTEAVFVCLSQHGFIRRLALTKGLTTGLGSIDSMLRKVVRYRGSSRKNPLSIPNSETFCFASTRVFEESNAGKDHYSGTRILRQGKGGL